MTELIDRNSMFTAGQFFTSSCLQAETSPFAFAEDCLASFRTLISVLQIGRVPHKRGCRYDSNRLSDHVISDLTSNRTARNGISPRVPISRTDTPSQRPLVGLKRQTFDPPWGEQRNCKLESALGARRRSLRRLRRE